MTGATRNGNKNLTFNYLEYFVILGLDLTNLASFPFINRGVEGTEIYILRIIFKKET